MLDANLGKFTGEGQEPEEVPSAPLYTPCQCFPTFCPWFLPDNLLPISLLTFSMASLYLSRFAVRKRRQSPLSESEGRAF